MECCRVALLQSNHNPVIKNIHRNAFTISGHEVRTRQSSKIVKMGIALTLAWQLGCGRSLASHFEKDPIEPFTLYGSISKKYCIEKLVEGKVVGRKKGLTANVCVNALEASRETPELQRLPLDVKVNIIGEPSCEKGEGQTKEESCTVPCKKTCDAAVSRHLATVKKETGYILDEMDRSKVVDSCSIRCFNECLKSGKSTSFVYPYRSSW